VKAGDILTLVLPGGIKVLEVKASGHRRGPYAEACQLYAEVAPKDFSD
jgi:ribosomal 50S subunit-recycling heat shock protein